MTETIRFENWFDPYKDEHIEACKVFNETGCWPEAFIPDNVEMEHQWHIWLIGRLAWCWVKHFDSLKGAVL